MPCVRTAIPTALALVLLLASASGCFRQTRVAERPVKPSVVTPPAAPTPPSVEPVPSSPQVPPAPATPVTTDTAKPAVSPTPPAIAPVKPAPTRIGTTKPEPPKPGRKPAPTPATTKPTPTHKPAATAPGTTATPPPRVAAPGDIVPKPTPTPAANPPSGVRKQTTLVWEGEAAKGITNKENGFRVSRYTEDPSGDGVSGDRVIAIAKVEAGVKIARDEVHYTVNVPRDGTYYLWGRCYWSTGCGNSVLIRVSGYDAEWILGGDATYDLMHWPCLTDGGDNSSSPRPVALKAGKITFTMISREAGIRVDQFLLTTDARKRPAGVYDPTPDALAG